MIDSILLIGVFNRSIPVQLHHGLTDVVNASVGVVSAAVGMEPLPKDALVAPLGHDPMDHIPSHIRDFIDGRGVKFRTCFKARGGAVRLDGRRRISLHTMGGNFRHVI